MTCGGQHCWAEEYRPPRVTADTPVGLLLTLYDEAISRLERAAEMLSRGAEFQAAPLLLDVQNLVYAMAESSAAQAGDVNRNLARLYEFCLHCLGNPSQESVGAALKTLSTLREGFESIRETPGSEADAREPWPALDVQL